MTTTLVQTTAARIPTKEGEFWLYHYVDETDGKEHLALVMGDVAVGKDVLTRVHSECFTGDVLGSRRCDCGEQLQRAMQMIADEGCGIILYLRQEGRGIGLAQKLRAYNLQDDGYDTVDANLLLGHQADERRYDAAAAMLTSLGVCSIRLLTNNPDKIERLAALGIRVDERVPLVPLIHPDNTTYLTTKVRRMRHMLELPNGHGVNGHAVADHAKPITPAFHERIGGLKARAATHYRQCGTPYVNLSFAQSLDGSIAARRGEPLALSGRESMILTHALRTGHDAILIGIGTVLADNPRLNVRLIDGPNPQPVIVDTHLRLPPNARLFAHHETVWVATTCRDEARRAALTDRGAHILPLPATSAGQVDINALLAELGKAGIRSLMVEGGATILSSFLTARLAHYVTITIAPLFVGGLAALDGIRTAGSLAAPFPHLTNPTVTQLGHDTIIWGELAQTAS